FSLPDCERVSYFPARQKIFFSAPFIVAFCFALRFIEPMRVLLIGSGGREHALAWKLADSPRVTALYALPGNPGMVEMAELVPGSVMEFDKIERFAKQQKIDL